MAARKNKLFKHDPILRFYEKYMGVMQDAEVAGMVPEFKDVPASTRKARVQRYRKRHGIPANAEPPKKVIRLKGREISRYLNYPRTQELADAIEDCRRANRRIRREMGWENFHLLGDYYQRRYFFSLTGLRRRLGNRSVSQRNRCLGDYVRVLFDRLSDVAAD